jgi:hypothetical protein
LDITALQGLDLPMKKAARYLYLATFVVADGGAGGI